MPDVKSSIILATKYEGAGAKAAIADAKRVQAAWEAAAKAAGAMPKGGGGGGRGPAPNPGPDPAQTNKSEAALLRLAQAQARLQSAQGDAAGAARTLETALNQVDRSSLAAVNTTTQLTRAQNALGKSAREAGAGAAVLPRTIAGLSHEAAGAVKNFFAFASAGAVVGTAMSKLGEYTAEGVRLVTSFQSTSAAMAVQLQGFRDLGAVQAQGQAFASRYKLTQEELNGALAASTGLLRSSKAGTEEILGVLARLTVLNPQETIEGAAFAVRELASGDIASIAERFNISRDAANRMKAEIASGADAIAVLSKYLNDSGISMDALAAKSAGTAGKLKDLQIAVEQIKIGLGEAATGPGGQALLSLAEQAATGFARLTGAAGGLNDALQSLAGIGSKITGIDPAMFNAAAEGALAYNGALAATQSAMAALEASGGNINTAFSTFAGVMLAGGDAAAAEAAAAQAAAGANVELANTGTIAGAQMSILAAAQDINTGATMTNTGATIELGGQLGIMAVQAQYAADAQQYATMAAQGLTGAQIEQALTSANAALEAQKLASFQQTLASISGNVRNGHYSASEGALALAQRYNIAYNEALKLIQAQMQLARLGGLAAGAFTGPTGKPQIGGAVGIVGTGGGQRRVGVGTSRVVSAEQSRQIDWQRQAATRQAKADAGFGGGKGKGKGKGAGGGGAGGVDPSIKAAQKQEDIATQSANKLADIEAKKMKKLQEIDQNELQKLAALYGKFARDAEKAMSELNEAMASDKLTTDFSQQLNDFDKYQKDLTEEQQQEIAQREAAEATYNQRMTEAREEAARIAKDVDAEAAKEIYEARKRQAERQREIDIAAAEARANASKKQKPELERDIAEAQAANDAQMRHDVEMAIAAAEERKRAKKQEVDDVRSAADEQRADAVAASQEQADAVITNSERSTQKVLTDLDRQRTKWAQNTDAVKDYNAEVAKGSAPPSGAPASTTTGDTTTGGGAAAASGGGGGVQGLRAGAKAAGGGSSPGSAQIGTLADALAIIVWLSDVARQNEWNRANDLPNFIKRLELATGSIQAIIDLSTITKKPVSPVDPKAVEAMVEDMVTAVTILGGRATGALNTLAHRIDVMSNAAKITVELLGELAEFRKGIIGEDGKLAAPIPAKYIEDMVNEAVFAVEKLSAAFARQTYGADFRKNLGEWVDGAGEAVALISDAADLSRNLQQPAPPIPPGMLERLADTTEQVVQVVSNRLQPLADEERERLAAWSETAGAAVNLLTSAASFDAETKDVDGTVLWSTLNNLADTTRDALAVIQSRLLPMTDQEVQALERWTSSAGAAVDALSSAAGLANDVKDLKGDGTIPLSVLQRLATLSRDALTIVQGVMLPTTEEQASALERWASASGAAVDTLASVASLYGNVKDIAANGLSVDLLIQLAEDARAAVMVAEATLIPYTEEQAALLQRWGDVTGASIGALQAALELRNALADSAGGAPPTDEMLLRLADDGRRALMALETKILPITEEMGEAYSNYAGAIESATSGLAAAFNLSGAMFADYVSPTDAQLNLISSDAQRVVKAVDLAARTFSTEGLDAAQRFGDAYGSIVGAFTEGLTFNAALASGDFTLDTSRLATFVDGARQMIRATATLGAEAAAVPAAQIAALNSTSAALTGFADAAIKMNAVPLNVPQFAGMGGAGGGSSVTFAPGSIVIQAAPGMNVNQVADLAVTKIEARMRTYR